MSAEEHRCDKALIIEAQGRRIDEIAEKVNGCVGRVADMETTMFGHTRNGNGFIESTTETLEIVGKSVSTVATEIRELRQAIKALRGSPFRTFIKYVVPPLATGGLALLAVWIAK